ncbi:MAG: hypothetical protein BGP03_31245 [Pseudonocardia sp. 73-21]|nr:MAG: hypothetical protein BGP03_31245 [Pseudonocardia sp. 73-21]
MDEVVGHLDMRALAAQLLVVGSPLADPVDPTLAAVRRLGVGGVILTGRSAAGVRVVADRSAALQGSVPNGRPGLLVSVDQEGGQVQTLSGPGFGTIPSAVVQGGWAADRLTGAAERWGSQLRAAGINVDLAPVSDVLSPRLGARNLSVGISDRTFGTAPDDVASGVVAFVDGLDRARVAATVKHFPGLGQVAPNTDTSRDVRDTVTTSDSMSLEPFRRAIAAGVPAVMVSSAIYARIDGAAPAAFSRAVITDLLRDRLGFTGLVVSDDLGRAVAVAGVAVNQRSVRFVAAGGDVVLTVDPRAAAPMIDGLSRRAAGDPAFAATVVAAARRVLAVKQRLGLLRC